MVNIYNVRKDSNIIKGLIEIQLVSISELCNK